MKTIYINKLIFILQFVITAALFCNNLNDDITIYTNGDILTMEEDSPVYVEAIAVKYGKILFAGSKIDAIKEAGGDYKLVDLEGKTLLPGFIDAHGHGWNAGFQNVSANLLPSPDGAVNDIPSLIKEMKSWYKKNKSASNKAGWIIGFGYDDSQLKEQRHPIADDLDKISQKIPVMIIHQSGHLIVLNHKALDLISFNSQTPDPEGGIIRREKDGKTPNGVLEETAGTSALIDLFSKIDLKMNEAIALKGVDAYIKYGFTTVQEGAATPQLCELWKKLGEDGKLLVDIACYPHLAYSKDYILKNGTSRDYINHFRIAGVKIHQDGSPQGKTAWLSSPYVVPPPGFGKNYSGYPTLPRLTLVDSLIELAFSNGWQVLSHCNGDAASEQFIEAVKTVSDKFGITDRRSVMIHAQTVRFDQLDRMKELGIIPSFFSMHTYYWGDWHRDETLGRERAYKISPAATTYKKGMIFTEHHDAPVGLPSSIMIIYTAVNRISRSGDIIGPDERISPYIALLSITKWAAYQYFEENSKGTLTKGKLADLVILDKNPLKIDPLKINDIKITETIKEGKTIYKLN